MSLEWMDNFSHYGTDVSNMLDGLWAENNASTIVDDPDGVSGGKVLTPNRMRRVFSGALTEVFVGCRVYFASLPASNTQLFILSNASNNAQLNVRVSSTGLIVVNRSANNGTLTQIAATASPYIVAGSWIFLEFRFVFGTSSDGSVELRVNERERINETGVTTTSTTNPGTEWSQITFRSDSASDGGTGTAYQMKDVRVFNSGGSQLNDFVGDCAVTSIVPESDVALNWTPSTGSTGFDRINETNPDDADYIQADDTPPDAYVCEMTDLDPDIVTVFALQSVVRALKTDSGTANLQVSMQTAGDNDAGADNAVSVNATCYFDISDLSPDTAAQWTPAEVDAMRLVIDRTA